MSDLSVSVRIALQVFTVPFLVGGIVLAGIAHSWLPEYMNGTLLWWILLVLFVFAGIGVGGLLAYGIIVFVVTWLAPTSPLLVESEVSRPTVPQRILAPAFRAIKKLAQWLAPNPRRP